MSEVSAFDNSHFEIVTDTNDRGELVILGCAFVGRPTREDWLTFVGKVKVLRRGIPFIMGDLLAGGKARYGETYAQAVEETDYDYDTLAAEKYVCERIPLLRRRKNITYFSYYREFAPLPVEEQEKLMDLVEAGEITTREQIREYKRQRRLGYVQDGWAVAMERDALAAENGRQRQELEAARARIQDEAAAACADPGAVAEAAWERDRDNLTITCPHCGKTFEVL